MNVEKVEANIGNQNFIIETGKLAKQANAAVSVTVGGTTVLVAVCMAKKARQDIDFFPLMVEYQEKTYAAGRIPGGFFKREGRPTQKEILTSRLIDRPIRPLFPKGFFNDVQVVCTVLSSDGENDPDILAIIGASTALSISDIPFSGPVSGCRVGLLDDQFVLNPTYEQREQCVMDLIVVSLEGGIVMIEGEANEVPESKVEEGLKVAHENNQAALKIQKDFIAKCGKEKTQIALIEAHPDLKTKVTEIIGSKLSDAYQKSDKIERESALNGLVEEITGDMTQYDAFKVDEEEVTDGDIKTIFEELQYEAVRESIFAKNQRADGRGSDEIRELTSEINVLPRTHGSALFTRGQTQSLAIVTLGTKRDEQMIESLEGVSFKNFMLHYNFPSFSVGETRPMRGPGRREIGHGALAAKALKAVLPDKEEFPYTIRVVSEILESNGSSSMASVCAGCLSLMVAGVPIKAPVAGISIGIVTRDNDHRLLTDIMGLEDHFGDMDFKIAGTREGITAIQLDLKITGLPINTLIEGIEQAKKARSVILDNMEAVIAKPQDDISEFAPRIISTQVPVEKIGEVIGPGGKMIKRIIEETGVDDVNIDDEGKVLVASTDKDSANKAIKMVNGLVEAPVVGKIYNAKVMKVANFGAFCEFLPGKQGLCHVSELSNEYVKDVESVVKVGDEFKVKLVEIDQMKRMNLSKKQAEAEEADVA